MRYGYWLPVFGGWLRNIDDEQMEATWDYNSRLARRSEEIGYDLTLIAELNLNDIKGIEAPSLDAWSTAAALAAVTNRLELMVAVRPTFHQPALLAKQAANIDHIAAFRRYLRPLQQITASAEEWLVNPTCKCNLVVIAPKALANSSPAVGAKLFTIMT